LTTPIDLFDGLSPLSRWIADGDWQAAWALRAVLALTDAAEHVGWRGDMRHLPSAGALPTPGHVTPFLVVKQESDGATFVICDDETPWLIPLSDTSQQVTARYIGPWPHDTRADLGTAETGCHQSGTNASSLVSGQPF
jgi:hypothetical protein